MGTYEIFEILLGIMVLGLGAYMFFLPKNATKEANRDNPEAIEKVKRSGRMLMIIGAILTILMIVSKVALASM